MEKHRATRSIIPGRCREQPANSKSQHVKTLLAAMRGVLPGPTATRANGFLAVMPPVVARSIVTSLYPFPASLILIAPLKVRSLAEHGLQSGAIIHSAFAGCQLLFPQSVDL